MSAISPCFTHLDQHEPNIPHMIHPSVFFHLSNSGSLGIIQPCIFLSVVTNWNPQPFLHSVFPLSEPHITTKRSCCRIKKNTLRLTTTRLEIRPTFALWISKAAHISLCGCRKPMSLDRGNGKDENILQGWVRERTKSPVTFSFLNFF